MPQLPLLRADAPDLRARVAAALPHSGVAAAEGVVDADLVAALRTVVDHAVAEDEAWLPDDRREREHGRVVFLPHYDPAPLGLLDHPGVIGPCEEILGDEMSMYTMTTICRPPGGAGWPVHVDSQYDIPGYMAGVGVMVLLDDFTRENGLTRFHPEVSDGPPDPDRFAATALELEAPAGTVCWFHGRAWHDALPNRSDRWRRAILFAVTRPWIAPRFDLARMLAHHDLDALSPTVRRRLGFERLAPGSYEEYYLGPDDRREALLRRAATGGGAPPRQADA